MIYYHWIGCKILDERPDIMKMMPLITVEWTAIKLHGNWTWKFIFFEACFFVSLMSVCFFFSFFLSFFLSFLCVCYRLFLFYFSVCQTSGRSDLVLFDFQTLKHTDTLTHTSAKERSRKQHLSSVKVTEKQQKMTWPPDDNERSPA